MVAESADYAPPQSGWYNAPPAATEKYQDTRKSIFLRRDNRDVKSLFLPVSRRMGETSQLFELKGFL